MRMVLSKHILHPLAWFFGALFRQNLQHFFSLKVQAKRPPEISQPFQDSHNQLHPNLAQNICSMDFQENGNALIY